MLKMKIVIYIAPETSYLAKLRFLTSVISQVRDQVDFFYMQIKKFATSFILWFWCVWPGILKVPKITSLQYLSNITRTRWGINLIFCMNINIKAFYKLRTSFWKLWPGIPKLPKKQAWNIFAISRKRREEWNLFFFFFFFCCFFLHADKHDTFLQVDSINFDGHGRSCQKYSK